MTSKRHNPPGRQKHFLRASTGFPAVAVATLIIALLSPALGGPIKAPAKNPEAAAPAPSADTPANAPAPGDADMLLDLVRGPLSLDTPAGQRDILSSADGRKDLPRMIPQTASPLVDHVRGAIVDLSLETRSPPSPATDAPWVDLRLAKDDPPLGQADPSDEGHAVILTVIVLGVAAGLLVIIGVIQRRRRQRRERYKANIRRHRHRLRHGGQYRRGQPPPTDHAATYDSPGGKS